jgi:hypothetical protein
MVPKTGDRFRNRPRNRQHFAGRSFGIAFAAVSSGITPEQPGNRGRGSCSAAWLIHKEPYLVPIPAMEAKAMTTSVQTQAPQEQSLQDSMLRLESALLAPVVSGELKSWTATVEESLRTFGADWMAYVKSVLHPQYSRIAKTDPNLLSRVDQMIQEDRQLLTDFARFESGVSDLTRRAEQVQRDESKAADDRAGVEKTGIDLILRIKKQQVAAATWLNEANYRDLGSAGD